MTGLIFGSCVGSVIGASAFYFLQHVTMQMEIEQIKGRSGFMPIAKFMVVTCVAVTVFAVLCHFGAVDWLYETLAPYITG